MRRGPLVMVLATLMFTLMISAVKVARQEMSALDVMLWRAVVALPISLSLALPVGLRIHDKKAMLLRGLFGFGAMLSFFTAAKGLPIADLSIVMKLLPILLALTAPLVLGESERAERGVWGAMFAGLLGCAMVIGPTLRVGSVYGLWAMSAVAFATVAHLMVRRLGRRDDPRAIVFWFQVAVLFCALLGALGQHGGALTLPPASLWPYLVATGLFAVAGQFLMTHAYKMDNVPNVAAAAYMGPVFGVAMDALVFSRLPTMQVIAGGSLVVGAGLWLVLRRDEEARLPTQNE